MSRYLISVIEQALWSALNLGVNLLLIRVCAPSDYGAFAFWSNLGYVLSSLQNALTVCHLQALVPGDGLSVGRLEVERLMHGVTGVFLAGLAALTLVSALLLHAVDSEFGTLAAALFIPAFLLQQYIRALAFSRGGPATAAIQTGMVLAVAVVLLGAAVLIRKPLRANDVLVCMGSAYGAVGVVGAVRALRGQGMSRLRPRELRAYLAYAAQSSWIFLGVTTTEVLARVYAFIAAGWFGAGALATLSATQQLLRPVPLLASSWSMVAKVDLARRREAGDWRGFAWFVIAALVGGVAIAAAWTGLIHLVWGQISQHLFAGKYGKDDWMVLLWGLSAALGFSQVVVSAALQVLRAFKLLALANAAASAVAVVAVLAIAKIYGVGGAVLGTAAGQAFELAAMAWVLMVVLARARRGSAAGQPREGGQR